MSQPATDTRPAIKGMNSFAKGEAPPPSGPPIGPPPPVPGNPRVDPPAVIQQHQQPGSPRRLATDLKFHPPHGGGAPVNPPPPPPGRLQSHNQGHIQGQSTAPGLSMAPTYPPPMQPSYPPATQPKPPSYPPPAPPVLVGLNGIGLASPIRRPRADSDAATSKLTDGFTASSDADMSYYPNTNPNLPPPAKNGDRREAEFQENLWRPKSLGRALSGAVDVFIGADGLMGTGNTAPVPNRFRDRLDDQREQHYSEPNAHNNAPSRRDRQAAPPIGRSNSTREMLRDDAEARASPPTLRDMGRTRQQHLDRQAGDSEPVPRGDVRPANNNDLERDFAAEDSDASAPPTLLYPVKIVRHSHRIPGESPTQPQQQQQHRSRTKQAEQSTTRKRRRPICDYDDAALAAMPYSKLRDEAFDIDPAQADKTSRTASHEALGLAEKLEQVRDAPSAQQLEFFCAMALDDWEAAGDWFMERFGDAMRRLRESRAERRRVIAAFEEEIARREEEVRGKTAQLDEKMRRMKKDSMRVISEE